MRAYRHIIAAIDPTESSASAVLDAAETLQRAAGARLTVASSFVRPPASILPHMGVSGADAPMTPEGAAADPTINTEQALQTHRDALADRVAKAGLDADVRAPMGNPADTIPELAQELGADVIVVGSHDRGFLEAMVSGSVSKRIAGHADCDVLFVSTT